MTAITVEHVSKDYFENPDGFSGKRLRALDDINFRLADGEVLAILGPSGCGKSTLLKIIAGVLKPDEGRVLYNDVPLADLPLQERGIGMVFQEGALIPHWEAKRSVGFFFSLRRRQEEIPPRVRQISNITGIGLNVLLERKPAQLSGGEQQRVSIARALTRDLRVLLMDEPFANIDAKLRSQARIELKRLMNEFPTTAIYVTHDQIEAVSLSQRVAVMNAGRIEQVGTYQQLYTNPVNLFVATFVGTEKINLLHGFVISGRWKGDSFQGFPIRKDLEEGTRVVLGVRPEHITLVTSDAPAAGIIGEGVVEQVTPFFAERYQLLDVYGNGERWQMHVSPDVRVRPRDRVRCTIASDHILYFDPQTEKRIG